MAVIVDIGVFAQNAAASIAAMIAELARQDILVSDLDVRVVILANGCTDTTVDRARAACTATGDRIEVVNLALGGKARTWNTFVHDLSRPGCDVLMFCDANIEMPEPDTLSHLVTALVHRPELHAIGSRAVKDITYRTLGLSRMEQLISAASETGRDWKTAISGQLYAMPSAAARALHLPIGLPIVDEFLRAIVLTDALTAAEDLRRIDGDDAVFHLFASQRSVKGLIRHQTRIAIGSAINAAVFAHIRSLPAKSRRAELASAARDDAWLGRVLHAQLPRLPFGYVPLRFLTKRAAPILARPRDLLRPKQIFRLFVGLGFDFIVYLNAQIRMARGTGAGH